MLNEETIQLNHSNLVDSANTYDSIVTTKVNKYTIKAR